MAELFLHGPQREVEVPRVGLVGADVLGRADRVEGNAELLVALGEARAIDIGEDHQLEVLLQIGECGGGIPEGRPVRHRIAEALGLDFAGAGLPFLRQAGDRSGARSLR